MSLFDWYQETNLKTERINCILADCKIKIIIEATDTFII